MKYDRRSFLRHSAGIVGNAGVLSLITACRQNGQTTIPRPCPPTRPGCRVLATRTKTSAAVPPVWTATRELRPPENWSPISPADFLSSFTVFDIDEGSTPIASPSGGCRDTFVFFVALPRGVEELLYFRQDKDGT